MILDMLVNSLGQGESQIFYLKNNIRLVHDMMLLCGSNNTLDVREIWEVKYCHLHDH